MILSQWEVFSTAGRPGHESSCILAYQTSGNIAVADEAFALLKKDFNKAISNQLLN